MNPFLISDIEKFKGVWCLRWMSAYRIQRWWRKSILSIEPLKKDYVRQIQNNYCHQLELLFYSVDKWNQTESGFIQIPEYLFAVDKMRDLIMELAKRREFYKFEIIAGNSFRYHENYINRYVAENILTDIPQFREFDDDGTIVSNRIIFIARKDSQRRRISNEIEVIDFLKSRIPTLEVVSFDNESSAIEQAIMFSQCKCLIGLHGAGLANLLWMTNVLGVGCGYVYEITLKGGYYHDYKKKAENEGFKHRYVEVEKFEKSEKSLIFPRDSILTMSRQEMEAMEDKMIEDGFIQDRFRPRLISNQIVLSNELDGATMRRFVEIPFD